ncbi:MAG TPA: hypothetical protein VEV42_09035 [Pyrinomonadaceae bacterium]|nr:hypothetical protein [Pyrinomonadaceae bacterium]
MNSVKKAKMMMQVKGTSRLHPALRRSVLFLLSAAIVIASVFAMGVVAQETEQQKPVVTKRAAGGRDPFRKYEPPPPVVKRATGQASIPSIQDRIAQYKAQKAAAMNARMPAPKPTTALLLSEIQVIGISRSPRGYAAIVEATPIKLSYVIYPGERLYDGQLVAIEDSRLVFRHETVFTDGRRERSVEYKPLRQATQVNSMSAPAGNQPGATANPQ